MRCFFLPHLTHAATTSSAATCPKSILEIPVCSSARKDRFAAHARCCIVYGAGASRGITSSGANPCRGSFFLFSSALGIWVNKQRMEKKFMDEGKRSSMTRYKLQVLEEIGFTWARRKGQPSWDNRYQELLAYRRDHGDCNVPTKYGLNPVRFPAIGPALAQRIPLVFAQRPHRLFASSRRLFLRTQALGRWGKYVAGPSLASPRCDPESRRGASEPLTQ